jgi:hypothetical protein
LAAKHQKEIDNYAKKVIDMSSGGLVTRVKNWTVNGILWNLPNNYSKGLTFNLEWIGAENYRFFLKRDFATS